MDTLIYGSDRPKVDFTQSPEGGTSYDVRNDHVVHLGGESERVSWFDLIVRAGREAIEDEDHSLHPFISVYSHASTEVEPLDDPESMEEFEGLVNYLADTMMESDRERKFFEMYVSHCVYQSSHPVSSREKWQPNMKSLWETAALVPQVWVNWIHYDPKDRERAKRRQKEPFRVDFMLIDEDLHESPIIIEVDGKSHFTRFEVDEAGETVAYPSLQKYTRHLRKDRWLRNQGWHVVRISNQEVEWLEEEVSEGQFGTALRWFISGDEPTFGSLNL